MSESEDNEKVTNTNIKAANKNTAEDKQKKKDSQSIKYFLTINNPDKYGYSHQRIKEIAMTEMNTCIYLAMADEIGNETHTFHTHIFLYFSSKVRFSTVQKHFPHCDIRTARGLVSQCILYIQKGGKWADSDKSETSVEGSFEEVGSRPTDSRGNRADMTELYAWVNEGLSNAQIITLNQDYILNIDKIDKLRLTLLSEKYKSELRLNLQVIYRQGKTGTGKTRKVLEDYGPENVYRIVDYSHPYDSYQNQSILVYEEFRNSVPISEMLNYLDIYPIDLKARYSNKFACYTTVYIISNWKLEDQYKEAQLNDKETYAAFLRRIHTVEIFHTNGEIETYDRDEYFNRFTKATDTPFE